MSWKLGSTVLVLVAALGCSACGGTQHNAGERHRKRPVRHVHGERARPLQVQLRGRRAADDRRDPRAHQPVRRVTDRGVRPLPRGREGAPHRASEARNDVAARRRRHVPGAALVLVDKSGIGSDSLGTLQLGGTVTVVTSCKGTGNFTVRFDPSSENGPPDLGTVCPEGRQSFSSPVPKSQAFRMSVDAGPHARWSVQVSATTGRR